MKQFAYALLITSALNSFSINAEIYPASDESLTLRLRLPGGPSRMSYKDALLKPIVLPRLSQQAAPECETKPYLEDDSSALIDAAFTHDEYPEYYEKKRRTKRDALKYASRWKRHGERERIEAIKSKKEQAHYNADEDTETALATACLANEKPAYKNRLPQSNLVASKGYIHKVMKSAFFHGENAQQESSQRMLRALIKRDIVKQKRLSKRIRIFDRWPKLTEKKAIALQKSRIIDRTATVRSEREPLSKIKKSKLVIPPDRKLSKIIIKACDDQRHKRLQSIRKWDSLYRRTRWGLVRRDDNSAKVDDRSSKRKKPSKREKLKKARENFILGLIKQENREKLKPPINKR